MSIIRIHSLSDPGVDIFSVLTEAQLRNRLEPEKGIFIAESPKVIQVALDKGYEPLALLCEERHITGDAADIIRRCGDMPVYTGERGMLGALTGYNLTRGVLCAMRRPEATPSLAEKVGERAQLDDMLRDARRVVVIDGVVDTTNIGAIFRSAAALGIDAVLLPWTYLREPLPSLHHYGFQTAAMALSDDSIPLDDSRLKEVPRLAIVMGTEGDGLAKETIADADYVVRIPMFHNVDSLNVAAAAAVAFWELRK